MKPTTKIRFTEPQIALLMRAHPNCNLDHLTEIFFEFDQAGKVIDCMGTIKDGGNIDHDYAGNGLVRLYETARRQLTARQTSATILQFPNGERLANSVSVDIRPAGNQASSSGTWRLCPTSAGSRPPTTLSASPMLKFARRWATSFRNTSTTRLFASALSSHIESLITGRSMPLAHPTWARGPRRS